MRRYFITVLIPGVLVCSCGNENRSGLVDAGSFADSLISPEVDADILPSSDVPSDVRLDGHETFVELDWMEDASPDGLADTVSFAEDQPEGAACADASHCAEELSCSQGRCTPNGFAYIPPGDGVLGVEDESFACDYDPDREFADGAPADDSTWYPRRFRFSYGWYMGTTEVTMEDWLDPSMWEAAGFDAPPQQSSHLMQHPVERITFSAAMAWANVRSRAEGLQECYELSDCRAYRTDRDVDETVAENWDDFDASVLARAFTERRDGDEEWSAAMEGAMQCHTIDFAGLDCRGYRLPTEFEWEYAARAGTYGNFVYRTPETEGIVNEQRESQDTTQPGYCDLDLASHRVFDAIAWWGCEADIAQPVGLKEPNRWGLYDMVGNVDEWLTTNNPGLVSYNLDSLAERVDGAYVDPVRFVPDDPTLRDLDGEDRGSTYYYQATAGTIKRARYVGIWSRRYVSHDHGAYSIFRNTGFRVVRRVEATSGR